VASIRCNDFENTILGIAPSTRYQGSKRKILPWIWQAVKEIEFQSVLDVFGGTGCVSYLFKRAGKKVTFNDHLKFNYLSGHALIENDDILLADDEIARLTAPLSRRKSGFVTRTFKGIYFTDTENRWIDTSISRIWELSGDESILSFKRAIAFHALFQTCLVKRPFNLFHRANLYLRQADVERGFGNKATWEKRFAIHFKAFLQEAQKCVFPGLQKCFATNCDALMIPRTNFDLVYLDPPYLRAACQNETADYLSCYHFLEGLARYAEWPLLIENSANRFSLKLALDTRWNELGENTAVFDAVFEKFRNSIIVMSYKKYGSPSIATLKRLLERHGRKVSIRTRHYSYALNQQNGSATLNRECLLIAE
jgi:adenine-specific DNA-methyltransferase